MSANDSTEAPTAPSSTWDVEATVHCLRPPLGRWSKIIYYSRRFGVLRASCALVERRLPLLWRLVGPVVANEIFYGYGRKHLYTPGEIQDLIATTGFVAITRLWYRDARSELARFDSRAARFSHPPEISQY